MLESSSERELNAVCSEHSKNIQNDIWRKFQLTKALAKEGHPYGKFSTGNKDTLSHPDLRGMLLKFYNSHYSSNLMKLVVYGQKDVETLSKEVESRFCKVVDKNYESFRLKESPFGDKVLNKLIKIVPVTDKMTLELIWIIKNKSDNYKSPPSRYVSHVLGHEGKGSLLSCLIAEGLATSLNAGGSDSYKTYS